MRLLACLAEARTFTETAWEEQRGGEETVRAVCLEGRILEEGQEGTRESDYGRLGRERG
jgi:hypothetical protein